MMRLALVFALFLAFSSLCYALSEVELYPEGAWVREEVEVSPGTAELRLDIPYTVSLDSFRALSQGFYIDSISFSTTYLSDDEVPAIKEIKNRMKMLEEEKERLQVRKRSADLFFDIFKAMLGRVDMESPSGAQAWMTLIEDRVGRYVNEVKEIEKKMKEVDSEIGLLRERLKDIDTPDSRRRNVAILKLRGNDKGGKVIYSYYSSQAGWSPKYKLTLLPDERKVDVEVYAELWQKSGKDWRDVYLTLASIRKGESLVPPSERNLIVDIVEEKVSEVYKTMQDKAMPMTFAPAFGKEPSFKEVETGVKIGLKEPTSVPSTGERQKLLIWKGDFKVEDLFYLCRPYIDPLAYRMATIKVTSPFDLLSGEAEIFVGETFIGKRKIEGMSREGSYDICFGSDERIEVNRRSVRLGETGKGVLDKSSVRGSGFEIDIKNLTKREINLVLDDVFPIPLDSRIKVELVKVIPKESERTETGHLKWRMKLLPDEEKKITFLYNIIYPQGEKIRLSWR